MDNRKVRAGVINAHYDLSNTMKYLYLSASLLCSSFVCAQTSHEVTVSNFAFSPASLTINAGDTVRWTNSEGFHNVNGTEATFPDNPQSFGNSLAAATWVYEFVFTESGAYQYRCDQHPATMTGQIVVEGVSSTRDQPAADVLSFYPNPTAGMLYWTPRKNYRSNTSLQIFDITGRVVVQSVLIDGSPIDISVLPAGLYTYQLLSQNKVLQAGKIVRSN